MKAEICIPTYKRPEAINELLQRYLGIFTRMGFDMHIFDSSDDSETKEVFDGYSGGNRNLFYHKIDPQIHSNMKVYSIYEEFASGDYDYIWVQSDSIRWTVESLELIIEAIKSNKYDLIVPNYRDVEKIGTREYQDFNDFFLDCAWHLTLYGAVVLKKTVFKNVDWIYLRDKYGIPERINFSHVGMYFEQISKMDQFKAYHISLPEYSLTSTLFKKESGWRKDTFFIHCECWPSVITALPDVYKNKTEVIKKQGKNSGDLTIEGIKRLRAENVLTAEVIRNYSSVWKKVSDISLARIYLYAYLSPNMAKALMKDVQNEKRLKRRIKKFCKSYEKIYIYGCGQKGDAFSHFLDDMNINYEGFLISRGKVDKTILRGKPVWEIDDNIAENEKAGIVMALNRLNTRQVLECLTEINMKAGIFTEYTDMLDEVGGNLL